MSKKNKGALLFAVSAIAIAAAGVHAVARVIRQRKNSETHIQYIQFDADPEDEKLNEEEHETPDDDTERNAEETDDRQFEEEAETPDEEE